MSDPARPSGSDPRARLVALTRTDFSVVPGKPLPLGVNDTREGVNFSVVSRNSTEASLVLYAIGYLATRILMQAGFQVSNLGGGFKTYLLHHPNT